MKARPSSSRWRWTLAGTMPRIVAADFNAAGRRSKTVHLVIRSKPRSDNALLASALMRHVIKNAGEVHPIELPVAEGSKD